MPLLARDTLRILHVEDDNDFAELSALSLRKVGFAQPITRCRDGLLALRYFSAIDPECGPHVILLDLNMPRMNGLEVLRWLRRNYSKSGIAVYLLTSSDNPAHKRQAQADGVTEYLIKSPSQKSLIEKLDLLITKINAELAIDTPPENGISPPAQPRRTGFPQPQAFSRSGADSYR